MNSNSDPSGGGNSGYVYNDANNSGYGNPYSDGTAGQSNFGIDLSIPTFSQSGQTEGAYGAAPPIQVSSGGQNASMLSGNGASPFGGAYLQGSALGGDPSGSGQFPWSTIFNNDLGNKQLDQQQQWLNYQIQQYMPAQLAMQQDIEKTQQALAVAQATGDYNGVQTLQAKLQFANENLANFQANMNATMQMSGLTGQINGAPTLQAQQMQNQFAALGGNQQLTARGQNVDLANNVGNQDVQMAGIQAQLAQSPLVAWYTARGLPPPQSAIMTAKAPDLSNVLNQVGAFQTPTYNWNLSGAPNAPQLSTSMS